MKKNNFKVVSYLFTIVFCFISCETYVQLDIASDSFEIEPSGGKYFTNIFCGSTWSATSDVSWCSISPNDSAASKLNFEVEDNPTLNLRSATITVQTGNNSKKITINQKGKLPDNSVHIKASTSEYEISFYIKTEEVTVSWGDGTSNKYTPTNKDDWFLCDHVYDEKENNKIHDIILESKKITALNIAEFDGINNLAIGIKGCYYALSFGNCPNLVYVNCSNFGGWNPTTLDVGSLISLKELYCSGATRGGLSNLNISKNSNLNILNCGGNMLSRLDISNNTKLTTLDVSANDELMELVFGKNEILTNLNCSSNQSLKNINLNGLTSLKVLDCSRSNFTNLDITPCTLLETIWSSVSYELATLIIGNKNIKLKEIDCSSNKLSASSLNNIFENLPIQKGTINISGNPGRLDCNLNIAINKGWSVKTQNP